MEFQIEKRVMDAAVEMMFRDYNLQVVQDHTSSEFSTGAVIKSDGSWICNGLESFARFLIDSRIIVSEYGQCNRIKADEWLKVDEVAPTPAPVVETLTNVHGPNDEFHNILVRGGRTGRKVHTASNGGSGSDCGHWFKAHTSHFKIADDTLENRAKYHRHLCEKCFSETAIAKAKALSTK